VQPRYTKAAADAMLEGVVNLRIIFLSSGKIGSITYVPARARNMEDLLLKYGLVDKAIEAAKQIEFIPRG
jgi:hypothetical protein